MKALPLVHALVMLPLVMTAALGQPPDSAMEAVFTITVKTTPSGTPDAKVESLSSELP